MADSKPTLRDMEAALDQPAPETTLIYRQQLAFDAPFPYVVCAGSLKEAREWARARHIKARDMVYASGAPKLDGMRDFAVVRLPGFFGTTPKHQRSIEAAIRRNEVRRR